MAANKISKKDLEILYLEKKMSMPEISKALNVSEGSVHYYLSKFKLNRKDDTRRKNISKEALSELYVVQNLTKKDVAIKLGVSINTITKNLEFYGIEKHLIDAEEVRVLYLVKKKTMKEIATILGTSYSKVNRILKDNDIKARKRGNIKDKIYNIVSPFKQEVKNIERLKDLFDKCIPVNEISKQLGVCPNAVRRKIKELKLKRPKSMMSREFYNSEKDSLYVNLYKEGKTPQDIAKENGISRSTVINHLKRSGVKLRTQSQSQFNYRGKEIPQELNDYEKLYDMYVSMRMSKKEIAEALGVSPNVINRVLKHFNIHIRNSSEAKVGLFSGPKHPNWKGGRSGLYSRLREYFRMYQIPIIIERDGKKCQMCGKKGKSLHVHHIVPFKEIFDDILKEHQDLDVMKDSEILYNICIKDERLNDLNNLITYCKECHLYKIHNYKKTVSNESKDNRRKVNDNYSRKSKERNNAC